MPTLNQALEIIKKNKISNNKIAFIEKLNDIDEEIKGMLIVGKKGNQEYFINATLGKKLLRFLQTIGFKELLIINETINNYNLWKNKLNSLINKNKILFIQNGFKENKEIFEPLKQEDIFLEITNYNNNSIFNKNTLNLFFSKLKHSGFDEYDSVQFDIIIEKEIFPYKIIKKQNKQFKLFSKFKINESNYELFYNMKNEIISYGIIGMMISNYGFMLNDYGNKNLKQYELFLKEFRIPKEYFLEIVSNIWSEKDIEIIFSDKNLVDNFVRYFGNDDNKDMLKNLGILGFKFIINTDSFRTWYLDQILQPSEHLILSNIYNLEFDSLDEIEESLSYYF